VTVIFAILLVLHGLIHLMGFAKAFRYAELPNLTQPISPVFGVVWLATALLFVTSAVLLFAAPRWWWTVAAVAVMLSTIAIWRSWSDAKYGVIANVIVLAGIVFGFLAHGPFSLLAQYQHDVDERLRSRSDVTLITDEDLNRLPFPVARYLRTVGVVGQPRVTNFRATMHGRFRRARDARWMTFSVEQHNFFDRPSRFFYMTASTFGVPFQGYHRYAGTAATMRVKAAALIPVADASGDLMTQGETVTMFNDMCFLAPATLIDPRIHWKTGDSRAVHAVFTNAGKTIGATLNFAEDGHLVDFESDDRLQVTPDGELKRVRWSTPIGEYRSDGYPRVMQRGDARWHEPEGEFVYIELELDEIAYNLTQ